MSSINDRQSNSRSFLTRKLEPLWEKHYAKSVITCYWLLGLCNNFAYVIMLSAARDILSTQNEKNSKENSSTTTIVESKNVTNIYDCNTLSTGTILLADIIPGFITRLIFPFIMHKIPYSLRVFFVILSNIACFLICALTPAHLEWLIFIGVGFASIASAFGEITFLALTTLYSKKLSITGWASGTGGAGFIGSFGYAMLTSLGLTPSTTILIMLVIPVIMCISYIMLPSIEFTKFRNQNIESDREIENKQSKSNETLISVKKLGFIKQKLELMRPLLKYMIPLFLVYFAQYFINQGLFELLYFKDSSISEHESQYR